MATEKSWNTRGAGVCILFPDYSNRKNKWIIIFFINFLIILQEFTKKGVFMVALFEKKR